LTSLLATLFFALLSTASQPVQATTIVPVSDRDLTLSSRAIVEGTVVDSEPIRDADRGLVYTYVTVDVDRVYKGSVPPGQIVLKQLGGRTRKQATELFGAPELSQGERVLLFLNTDRDGALRIAHFSVGLYAVVRDEATGREIVRREIEGELLAPRAGETATDVAAKEEFVARHVAPLEAEPGEAARYEAAYDGVPVRLAPREYVASSGEPAPPTANYEFLNPGFRWFEADAGVTVKIKVNPKGAPTPSNGIEEVKAALEAWGAITGSSLRVAYGGTASTRGRANDAISAITFGDPANELDDPVNCSGVVAVGGVTASDASKTTVVGGKVFAAITEADIVVNNGFECILSDSAFLSEILTHETGHTIGIGHSNVRDATMYFQAHGDRRGASLRADDSDAARFLYPGEYRQTPLEIKTAGIPDALSNSNFSFFLRADGGKSPRLWELTSGELPAGLHIAQDGHIYGVATTNAEATVTLRVRDAAGGDQTRTFTFNATQSPAPHLARVAFKPASGKLKLVGTYLTADATILLNGAPLPADARVSFNASKGKMKITGVASSLFRSSGQNTISVVVRDQASNTLAF
jgi:hypothetical protein